MDDCIFCQIVRGEEKSWPIYDAENAYAFLCIHPASEYHTLVIPKAHFEDVFDIPEEEFRDMMGVVKRVVSLLQEKLGVHDVQIINSSGAEAQQDVFHVHFHIVPRKSGDGQDVQWTTHPEWQDRFDKQLEKLR